MSLFNVSPGLSDMITSTSKILSKRPKERKWVIIIFSIIALFSITGTVINEVLKINEGISIFTSILSILSLIILSSAIQSFLIKDTDMTVNDHIEKLIKQRNELSDRISEKGNPKSNVMDVIRINLSQLDEYYTMNKVQASRSYSISIVMIVTGFIVLISVIVLWAYGKLGLNITIITSLAGLIAEFIGATSLLLYKESTKQIQAFFEKLSYLQHIMLAVELSERLSEEKKEDQISQIISSLIKNGV